MDKKVHQLITDYVNSGPSKSAIAEMLDMLVEIEYIRFDDNGIPYWIECGEKVGAGDFE